MKIFIILLSTVLALNAQNYANDPSFQRELDAKGRKISKDEEMLVRIDITNWAFKVKAMNPAYQARLALPHPRTKEQLSYSIDCSGLVAAVYTTANVSVFEKQAKILTGPTGVKIIYDTLKGFNKVYRRTRPRTGDIVFFNNTWDMNGNGKVDDLLTHAGIVLDTDGMGVIRFMHSYSKGVSISYANLYYKDKYMKEGREFNTFLRRKYPTDASNTPYLAGEMIYAFGTVFDIPENGEEF
ncbi:MAG: C40 family peptidase [Spirochaetes bacterium]|nr:C40 family peptidase [Spirochaetota bacterium]